MADFGDFTPEDDELEDPRRISRAVQAKRDLERARILRAEIDDPNLPGGDATRESVKRELGRMGGVTPPTKSSLDFGAFVPKVKDGTYPEPGPVRAATPGPKGQLSQFWETLTNESLGQILERGLIPNLAKGIARKMAENSEEGRAAKELYESSHRGPLPKGERWSTIDELFATGKHTQPEDKASVADLLQQAKEHLVKNPGATTAEFLKGIVADPELLLPVFGSTAGATKLSSFVARLAKLGKAGETAVRAAATAGELTIKGGAVGGAVTAGDQFAKGVYNPEELAANTAISGAMFGAIGAVRGMFTPKELRTGNVEPKKAQEILEAWAEKDPEVKAAVEAGKMTADDVKRRAFIELNEDRVLNARAKADRLMQTGASKAEVERVIKRDPLVGEEMDKIRKRREDVAASRLGTVLQGEPLDPAAKPGPAGALGKPPGETVDMPPVQKKLEGPRAEAVKDTGLPAGQGFRAPKGQRGAVDVTIFDDLTSPDARDSALGPLLAAAPYTLKSLERLPQNRFEFTVDMIKQELRRQDITDAERGVMEAALGRARPDGKITATELMRGVKAATGDFELTAKPTERYAQYGLENIDRLHAPPDEPVPGWDGVSSNEMEGPPATTTLYRLPEHMPMSDANHFNDERLFGWTRSFKENGVRHVVEIQSDLAQHTKGAVKPEEIDALLEEHRRLGDRISYLAELEQKRSEFAKRSLRSPEDDATFQQVLAEIRGVPELAEGFARGENNYKDMLNRASLRIQARRAELMNKYLATAIDSQLAPVIKNWPKRLIREELAQAAKELEIPQGLRNDLRVTDPERLAQLEARPRVVRFATADTVAKVEGWPTEVRYKEGATAFDPELRKASRVGTVQADDGMRHFGEFKYTGNLKVVGGRVFGELSGDRGVRFWSAESTRVRSPEAAKALGQSEGFRPEHQSIYDRYNRDITKFLKQLGGKEVTDSAGHTWIEVPVPKRGPVQMFGRADENLVATLGAVGAGAALGYYLDKEPGDSGLGGAVIGAGLGLVALHGKAIGKSVAGAADVGLGLLSTRIRNISEPLLHRAREFERRSLQVTHQRISQADAFLRGLNKVGNPELERAIMSNDTARINALMPKELKTEWQKTRAVLDEVGRELKQYDRLQNLREGYFPRIVKDREGLLEALGATAKTELEQRISRANRQSIAEGNGPLDAAGESSVINTYLQERAGGERPGFTKQRRINEITEALQPFYANNTEALHTYLRSATGAIERSKFFGRDLVTKELDGRQIVDLNSSIGRVVQREFDAGRVTPAQADELAAMLRARFESKAANPTVQDLKNLANIGLLGNVISAGTQLGDVATAVYAQGLRPSLESLARLLAGRHKVSMKDFGLVDHISEEFVSTRGTAKALNTLFKLSGFSSVDALGKNVMLNAALSKYQRLAASTKGELQIAKKYSAMFGDDYPKLVEELKSKTVGEQTQALLFSELSDFQPISKLEVPQKYLEMPNGRVLYMLKTFMLKQADIVRRDAYNEMRKGNVATGVGNLLKLGLALGISGATTQTVKDWILGRPVDFESADIALNFLKTFGLSEYVLKKAKEGKPVEAILGTATPPYKMMDDIIRQDPKAVRYIPLIGPLLEAHEFGGADKATAKGKGPEAERAKERLRKARERQKLEQRLGG